MKTIFLKCKLLSDIIINQNTGTEGNQKTLDFIPGSNFLGIAAATLYKDDKLSFNDLKTIFYSGKVRFGDAHQSINGKRSLPVPLSYCIPKNEETPVYIHHFIDYNETTPQFKQLREGFFIINSDSLLLLKTKKNFSIKSEYDRVNRRAKDEIIFGYESIEKGLTFCFEVAIDDDVNELIKQKIKESLIGQQRVGRSKTAQYGLVEITEDDENVDQIDRQTEAQSNYKESDLLILYAESRLIFFDKFGFPTFTPTISDFGFEQGEILWDQSQIRTFQYSPWNNKRATRDADRCGIEKGSVIVIKTENSFDMSTKFVGYYQNEGFGKILINPDFLIKSRNNGLLDYNYKSFDYKASDVNPESQIDNISIDSQSDVVLKFLQQKSKEHLEENKIYNLVNNFVSKQQRNFSEESFASQWGSLRRIAYIHKKYDDLVREINEFLDHGVASDKWNTKGRKTILNDFFVKIQNEVGKEALQAAIINLASEMAKTSRRN